MTGVALWCTDDVRGRGSQVMKRLTSTGGALVDRLSRAYGRAECRHGMSLAARRSLP